VELKLKEVVEMYDQKELADGRKILPKIAKLLFTHQSLNIPLESNWHNRLIVTSTHVG
jgi:hypothetical protein